MIDGDPESFDARTLRNALGMFATGVAVVTTRDADGHDVGLTVNSFTSVSLSPPLVLFCLARDARSFEAFTPDGVFAVNVLGAAQQALSNRFAQVDDERFADLSVERGRDGAAFLPGCIAHFECRTERQLEGGDHLIILGRVLSLRSDPEGEPLLFFGGRYAELG